MSKDTFDLEQMAFLRRKFSRELAPIMEMLDHHRSKMKITDWNNFVKRIELSVIAHPDQYLPGELPSKEVLKKLVHLIFEDYLKSVSE